MGTPTRRNALARAVTQNPLFRQRVVPVRKGTGLAYDRTEQRDILRRVEDELDDAAEDVRL